MVVDSNNNEKILTRLDFRNDTYNYATLMYGGGGNKGNWNDNHQELSIGSSKNKEHHQGEWQ